MDSLGTAKPVFVGKLYKNEINPWNNALVYICILVVAGLLISMVAADSKVYFFITLAILVVVLIGIAFNRRLTFNEMDDNNIIITPAYVKIGELVYYVKDFAKMGLYVDCFYGFKYFTSSSRRVGGGSSYGMNNRIYFRIADRKFEYKFVITDAGNFFSLYAIIKEWERNGISFALKETYGEELVRKKIKEYNT